MKAVIRNKYVETKFLKISEVESPVPKTNEVLVKVHCTTVNRTDCSIVTGKPFVIRFFTGLWRPKKSITGTDFAGQVVAIGKDVKDFKIGDRVFGLNDEGISSHAEYLTIGEDKAIGHIPSFVSYSEAVASAEGAHYALNFLNKVSINKGDQVLVNGATGAIGSATIQFLLLEGAIVTAVCSTEDIADIEAMGVEKVIDYKKEDFTELDEKFCVICDAVGKSRFSLCKRIMTANGIYVSSELGPRAENIFYALTTRNKSKKRVIFPVPVNTRKSILHMTKLLIQKDFSPLIDRIYAMQDIRKAFSYVQTGMKKGNVILKIAE